MPMCAADREHLHHRLLDLGLEHRHAVLTLWSATTLFAVAGIYLELGSHARGLVLVVTVSAAVLVLSRVGFIRAPSAELRARRHRNRARLAAVHAVADRVRHATGVADISRDVVAIAPAFGAVAVTLHVPAEPAPAGARGAASSHAQFPLDPGAPELGAVEVTWPEPRNAIDRDTEIVIEVLCRSVSRAVQRVEARSGHAKPGLPAPSHHGR
jgi:hypothetical protein